MDATTQTPTARPPPRRPPARRRRPTPTAKERRAAALVGYGGHLGKPLSYRTAAGRLGVTHQAVHKLVRSFLARLSAEQRDRYARRLGRPGRMAPVRPMQLSLVRQV